MEIDDTNRYAVGDDQGEYRAGDRPNTLLIPGLILLGRKDKAIVCLDRDDVIWFKNTAAMTAKGAMADEIVTATNTMNPKRESL